MKCCWLMHPEKGSMNLIGREDLAMEPKFNGWRLQIFKENSQKGIWGRRLDIGRDLTDRFVNLRDVMDKIPHNFHLDGEIVAIRNGKEDSAYVASALADSSIYTEYHVFDVLYWDEPVGHLSYTKRKEILKSIPEIITGKISIKIVQYCENTPENFKELCSKYEGIVLKSKISPYIIGEHGPVSSGWYKIKNVNTVDLIVGGIKLGAGKNSTKVGSLNCYVYNDKKLVYIGDVGSGLTDRDRQEFLSRQRPFIIEAKIRGFNGKHIIHASYERIREDKSLEDCKIGQLIGG